MGGLLQSEPEKCPFCYQLQLGCDTTEGGYPRDSTVGRSSVDLPLKVAKNCHSVGIWGISVKEIKVAHSG